MVWAVYRPAASVCSLNGYDRDSPASSRNAQVGSGAETVPSVMLSPNDRMRVIASVGAAGGGGAGGTGVGVGVTGGRGVGVGAGVESPHAAAATATTASPRTSIRRVTACAAPARTSGR